MGTQASGSPLRKCLTDQSRYFDPIPAPPFPYGVPRPPRSLSALKEKGSRLKPGAGVGAVMRRCQGTGCSRLPLWYRLPPPPPFLFTRISPTLQRLSQARYIGRPMSRYRPGQQSECPAPQEQLSLPLRLPLSAHASQSQSPEPSKHRRSRLSPARLAKFEEMRERRGIEQVSCLKITDGRVSSRSRSYVKLTPALMSYIKADITENADRQQAMSQHFLLSRRRKDPGLAKVARMSRGGSPRRLQANPLGRNRRRASLPALRLLPPATPTRRARFSSAKAATINSASRQRDDLRQPQAPDSRLSPRHRDLRQRGEGQ